MLDYEINLQELFYLGICYKKCIHYIIHGIIIIERIPRRR